MFEKEINELRDFLSLFNSKLQEVQENQRVIAQNQELLAKQNNKIIEAFIQLEKDLFVDDEPSARVFDNSMFDKDT